MRLTNGEIARLAAFKEMSEVDFIQRFTRLATDRRGLALMEKPSGECVFLDGNDCSVQSVKPQQCRDFPNLWNFPGFEQVCKAMPKIVSAAEYELLVLNATGRRPPAPNIETSIESAGQPRKVDSVSSLS